MYAPALPRNAHGALQHGPKPMSTNSTEQQDGPLKGQRRFGPAWLTSKGRRVQRSNRFWEDGRRQHRRTHMQRLELRITAPCRFGQRLRCETMSAKLRIVKRFRLTPMPIDPMHRLAALTSDSQLDLGQSLWETTQTGACNRPGNERCSNGPDTRHHRHPRGQLHEVIASMSERDLLRLYT